MLQLLTSPLQRFVASRNKLAMPDVTVTSLRGWVTTSEGIAFDINIILPNQAQSGLQ
jgi:hypothetical protein